MNELAWRHHFSIISLWEIFRRSRAANSIVSGPIWPKVKLLRDFMHVLITCMYKKNRIKNNWEKVETSFSPLKVNERFLLPWKPVLIQSVPKPYATFPPILMMLLIKFDQYWPTGLRDYQVSSELWQNDRILEGQGKSSIAPLFQSRAIINQIQENVENKINSLK